ncbi:hypothetical protein [Streptomyces sp. CB02414]|uniref:hypothetical protein n=1 Tax=Streptomyces sp. CB02414 TaxID=1703922 RepID=UPI000A7596E9|nr:hypothetical protein [Streptomyces sp. CB02414]
MLIPRNRRGTMPGAAGVLLLGLGGVAVATAAQAAPRSAESAAPAATDMPYAVEDFNYPGADRILEERGITLKRGDGHITLVPCTDAWNIKIESRLDNGGYCFRATAKSAYLSLELPDAYGVWTEEHPVEATLTADGKESVVNVPSNEYQPVGESGDTGLRSVLVELRVTG